VLYISEIFAAFVYACFLLRHIMLFKAMFNNLYFTMTSKA